MTRAWSYSSIKTFEQCPKKYYHLKVAKDFKDEGGEAAQYGTEAHEAAENFVKHGTPIPPKYAVIAPAAAAVAAMPGEKHTELKLGVERVRDEDGIWCYRPCDFFHPNVWWRGIVDVLVTNGAKARMLDYKTGKSSRYADLKQLDLMAGAVFVHFPEVMQIKSGLAFVVPGDFVPKVHNRLEMNQYLNVFNKQLAQLDQAHAADVWNPISGPLCGWCPVTTCQHHRPRRR